MGASLIMSRNQPSSWHSVCQEQDNIVSLTPPRLELVPERASSDEFCSTEVALRLQNELLWYRKLYEQLPSIYLVLDGMGVILSINQVGAASLGYQKEELLRKPVFELFTPNDRKKLADVLIGLFKASSLNEVVNLEFRLNCPSSKIVWVKVVAKVLPQDEQNPNILMVCEDITAHKRSEDALRESEQRFQIMANTAPVMLWMAGRDGLYNFFNEFWLEFTGRDIKQEQGIGWLDAVYCDDKINCLQTYYSALNARAKFQMEYRLRRADGEYRWILDTGIPRFTPSGSFAGYIGCCIDITERKSVEVALCESEKAAKAQVDEMERLNRLKDEFLSTVSHELRTPLTNMKMAIQMLGITLNLEQTFFESPKSQTGNPKAFRYFQILNNECDREINLINNFLDLQKLDTHVKPLVLETVIVQEWLVRIVELFKARNRNCQQSLHLNIDTKLPALVSDPFSLERILIELLTNACKFSPPGEEIIVDAKLKSQNVEFRVTNSGVEIPKQELERIFDKFYRIPSNDPWKQGGTGLGLALVQKLTKYLGGTLTVESESKRTCFIIQLPI